MERRYAVLPGDGIGVDVTREAVKVLRAAAEVGGFGLHLDEYDFGADLETQLVQLRREAMAERSRSAVAGIDSTSQLSEDARELLRGTSVNLEPTGN